MTVKASLAAVLILALIAGCSSKNTAGFGGTVLGTMAKGVIEARRGAQPAPDLGAGPAIQVKIASLGWDTRMVALDRDGDVTIWHDGQGRQIATRNGVLIWTRGLGFDLMSAKVPSPRDIRPGNQYQRVSVYVDGADRRLERRYDCTVEIPAEPDASIRGQQVQEVCIGPSGRIRNDYWLGGGRILRSKQWISAHFGHLEILPQ